MLRTKEQDKECDFEGDCCHLKLTEIVKLQESTRKLLCLLDDIQLKTHTKHSARDCPVSNSQLKKIESPINWQEPIIQDLNINGIKQLERATKALDIIHIEEEEDDCSIYNKLIRKCPCLNQPDYNDFVIHFNEDTKCVTNNVGEIIKNIKILKRFMNMGGPYARNVLMFLNDGLSQSSHSEKIEIIQGCTNADICNIFEENTIVIVYISWPCRFSYYGDYVTQSLTAGLILKIATLEEGRRYLNLNSKIANDIKKTLKKYDSNLESATIDSLNGIMDILKPVYGKTFNVSHFAKPMNEGMGTRTINDLVKSQKSMTFDEILLHLDIIHNLSRQPSSRRELVMKLPVLIILYKQLLREYDNSEMNILIMNTLSRIVSKKMMTDPNNQENITSTAETATEPIRQKNVSSQIPQKISTRKNKKSRLTFGVVNKSRAKLKDLQRSIIIVPIDKK